MSKTTFGKAIFLRGDTYWIRYSHQGQQKRESTGTKDYQEAERYYKRRLGEMATGKYAGLAVERIRFAELTEALIEDYILNEKRSLPETKMRLKKHLLPAFGKIRAAEFGTAHLKRYVAGRLKSGAANATINRELAIVSRVFNLAIEHDPPQVVRIPHIPFLRENNVRTGFLEQEQYHAVREQLPEELRLLFVALYHWGTRIGEMLPLEWTQVDLRGFEVRLHPGTTKNGEGRLLPIYGDLEEWLRLAKEIRDQDYPGCRWVFHRQGKRIRNFRKSWANAVAAVGVPKLRPHDLRRTAVRLMMRYGILENVAMKITGHKTRNIFDRYNIVSNRDLKLFRAQMNAHLSEQAISTTSTISSTIGGSERKRKEGENSV